MNTRLLPLLIVMALLAACTLTVAFPAAPETDADKATG
jgi:outer membrane biogenesis lipoprotein LolB